MRMIIKHRADKPIPFTSRTLFASVVLFAHGRWLGMLMLLIAIGVTQSITFKRRVKCRSVGHGKPWSTH